LLDDEKGEAISSMTKVIEGGGKFTVNLEYTY
jgi:hypothetical protein